MSAIRRARLADLPACHAILSDAIVHGTASWSYEPTTVDAFVVRCSQLIEKGFPFLVAEPEGSASAAQPAASPAILGYACVGPFREREGYRFCVENSIYVSNSCQGKGVGRALLAALIAATEAAGFRAIMAVISVESDDADCSKCGSVRLHGSQGFAIVGRMPSLGWKHGRWMDCVMMQRALGPAPAAAAVDAEAGACAAEKWPSSSQPLPPPAEEALPLALRLPPRLVAIGLGPPPPPIPAASTSSSGSATEPSGLGGGAGTGSEAGAAGEAGGLVGGAAATL